MEDWLGYFFQLVSPLICLSIILSIIQVVECEIALGYFKIAEN